ncbi:MAG: glycosyltransferase [Roseburia sp.]|nr:glycosyltransferase [Roseburia sp.]
MSTVPKISICIPAYNNADEVGRLLQSIAAQEYKDYEVNISDDSTDDAIEELVKAYPGVRYIHNERPLGHIFNWNAAIGMARGEYIKIMFSDDWFTDGKSLGGFAALLDENPRAALAFSGSRQVMLDGQDAAGVRHVAEENNRASYDRWAPEEYVRRLRLDYRTLFLSNQIGAPSATIYRRGEALTLFDKRSNWASDVFLYFELLQRNPQFAYTEKPLVSIGVHAHQYTESFSEKDMRIYNDYRYMYTKYRLAESRECREHMAENYIVKYRQGFGEAKALGIGPGLYMKKYFGELWKSICCFASHRRELLCGGKNGAKIRK